MAAAAIFLHEEGSETDLDGLEEYYPEEPIERVDRILREQMRKYPVYFM
jgi:hypothetical protein